MTSEEGTEKVNGCRRNDCAQLLVQLDRMRNERIRGQRNSWGTPRTSVKGSDLKWYLKTVIKQSICCNLQRNINIQNNILTNIAVHI